ncbi:MAG: hypothetical protein WCV41_01435 [Patescibacteria group bacterium]
MTRLVVLFFVLFLQGCAAAPHFVSTDVYKSNKDKIIETNKTLVESAKTYQLNEQQARERAQARQQIALAEINNAASAIKIISADGIMGGFPVIFINDSRRAKTIIIKKTSGDLKGYRWTFSIPAGRFKEYKLEKDTYHLEWTTEDSGSKYPTNGPAIFEVRSDANFFYDQTEKSYHGGYRLTGY